MIKLPLYIFLICQICSSVNLKAQNDSNPEFNFKSHLEESIRYPLSKYNLKPIDELNKPTLRVWRFPGGGAIFEQMIELRQSELTFYSYLLEDIEEKEEYSDSIFDNEIKDRKLKKRLKAIISKPEFLKTIDSENYCGPNWSCADIFFVQYTNGVEVVKFIVDHKIEKCDNLDAELSKNLIEIIKTLTNKF